MSLNAILSTGTSGLMAAQTQLRVVSDNVANVATPGYVRKTAEQVSTATAGIGTGVEIARIRLATDRFLQAASLQAGSDAARAGVRFELFDRLQALFGDPGRDASFFNQINAAFAAFAATAEDPVSAPRRQDALFKAQAVFDDAARIAASIQALRLDADGRIDTAVESINRLLEEVEALNVEISRATVAGRDASGAESAQAQLIDRLSKLMDVRVAGRPNGGVTLRTADGVLLAGDGVAKLSYTRAGTVAAETVFNEIFVTEPRGERRALLEHLKSGELKGLFELRDVDAPAAAERLGELVARIADELNRAHNAASAVPAPQVLSGRDTGLDLPTAVAGFTGRTTLAVLDAQGVIQRRVDVDFDAGTLAVDGAAFGAFTPASFLAQLNAAFGGTATASFADRALTLTAAAGRGIALADDAAAPASKAGRGFSHWFGLNDLVRADRNAIYETGLTAASAHGFTPGQEVSFRFTAPDGTRLRDVTVAVPAGGTMADLLTALNSPVTGVGRYGSFSLDAAGRMTFAAATTPPATLQVLDDGTSRGPAGPAFSVLFGVGGGVRASRADAFSLRADVDLDPKRLSLAQLNLAAPPGTPALAAGDGRGARALADAGERTTAFAAAGGAAAGNLSIARYVSDFAGDLGSRAASLEGRKTSAEALSREAASRRASHEGVNLDEELVRLTTYQQAFNASARLIQAAKDMYDVLIGMI